MVLMIFIPRRTQISNQAGMLPKEDIEENMKYLKDVRMNMEDPENLKKKYESVTSAKEKAARTSGMH